MLLFSLAFLVQSVFVVVLLFRIKRLEKRNSLSDMTSSANENVHHDNQTEEKRKISILKRKLYVFWGIGLLIGVCGTIVVYKISELIERKTNAKDKI